MLVGPQRELNLQKQFDKILDIDSIGLLNSDFMLGYIAAYMEQLKQKTQWHFLKQKVLTIENVKRDKLITQHNAIELVQTTILGCISVKNKNGISLKQFCSSLQENLNELVIDQKYLRKRFFNSSQMDIENPNKLQKTNSKLGLQCPICCEQITFSTVCPVACGHNLHKQCFQEYFKAQVSVKKFPILCPYEGCGKEINVSDIQEYITGEALEKYFEFSLHVFVDKDKTTNWCPTPGCSAIFQFDQMLHEYKCPSCKKNYCLRCKTESHTGFTCEQNMQMKNLRPEDKQFLKYVKGAQYKQCPSCKFWVSKNQGCDHMTCRCGYEFCYQCGAKYGTCECQSNYDDDDDDDFLDDIEEESREHYGIRHPREQEEEYNSDQSFH